jgi:adenine-specific DNA methylase
MRRLIESWLPLREVNEDAGLEVAFRSTRAYSGPRLRNVHVWFARRPAGVARVLTLAGILGDSVQQSLFVNVVGFNAREIAKKRRMPPLLFYTTPKRSTVDCWFLLYRKG